jgi:hypothetical protein
MEDPSEKELSESSDESLGKSSASKFEQPLSALSANPTPPIS